MIIELFGAPGSGKTFLTKQFLEHSHKNRKFLSREDFSTWLKDQDQLFKLRCIFRNLLFCTSYLVFLILLRTALQKPNIERLWMLKAILNEVMLREFLRLNSGSVILLDQGSVQRIVCFILFSFNYRLAPVQFILKFMLPMLSRSKIQIFINADTSISSNRVLNRTKDPSISRFDSIDRKDSLHEKISEVTKFFISIVMMLDSKNVKIRTFDNSSENKLNNSGFNKLISSILK